VAWEIECTDEFFAWWEGLTFAEEKSVRTAVEKLEERGPALGRPFVDTINGSRHANKKELRPRQGNICILFAFNPLRTALLLIGGDKSDRWEEWYDTMLPVADDLYDLHLRERRQEGALRWPDTGSSATSSPTSTPIRSPVPRSRPASARCGTLRRCAGH
jgi:hypothetical protein